MNNQGIYEEGEEIDFDHINEQNLKNIPRYEGVRDTYAEIDTKNIEPGKAFDIYSDINRELEPNRDRRDLNIEENPKDKFNRLQSEFLELQQELNNIAQKEEKDGAGESGNLPLLLREVQSLQKDLLHVGAKADYKKVLDKETSESLNTDQYILALKENLDYHKSEVLLGKLKDIERQGDSDGKNINYKIGLNDAPEKVKQHLKLADLQRRITNIEKVLGNTSSNEVIEGVKKLKKMTEMLSEYSLDGLLARITHISQQMDRLGNKKPNLNIDEYNMTKIERLYDAYGPVEKTVEQVPLIVNRLESLRLIHEESAKITNKVNRLRDNQSAVIQNLDDNKVLLHKIEETFGKNLTTIGENIKNLQDRMAKLK